MLERQIAKVGIGLDAQPTPEQLRELLNRVSLTYARSSEQRDQLAKTVELAKEAAALANAERHRATELLVAVGDALTELAGSVREAPAQPFEQVRAKWTSFLTELLDSDELVDGEPTLIRASHGLNRGFLAVAELLDQAQKRVQADAEHQRELVGANKLIQPDRDAFDLGFLKVAGACEPFGVCGGDFWTVRELEDGRALIAVGDATGHGIRATILAAAARAACEIVRGGPDVNLLTFCEHANHAVHELGRGQLMMTWVAGLFDPARREVQIANAGHRLPLLLREGEIQPIVARGSPLGSSESVDCEPVTLPLRDEDGWLFYTDGLVEAEGPNGERFSERRLRASALLNGDPDPAVMRNGMLGELRSFRGRRPRTDDLTLVLARVRAPETEEPWSSTR
jgi:serine phosphatase RsbU (regulator of sigma subunit)